MSIIHIIVLAIVSISVEFKAIQPLAIFSIYILLALYLFGIHVSYERYLLKSETTKPAIKRFKTDLYKSVPNWAWTTVIYIIVSVFANHSNSKHLYHALLVLILFKVIHMIYAVILVKVFEKQGYIDS